MYLNSGYMAEQDAYDPAGLIREAYRINGIGREDCRTIFLDWVLQQRERFEMRDAVNAMLEKYSSEPSDHPMTLTLREAVEEPPAPKRRGGARGRR
ncbi:MAG: hypothetical protein AAFP68_20370 [Pseudomonadota bacterium]